MNPAAALTTRTDIRDTRFVSEKDPGYMAFCRRAQAFRKARAEGPGTAVRTDCRAAATTEPMPLAAPDNETALPAPPRTAPVGKTVERAARRVLGDCVKLGPCRVIAWRERNFDGRFETRYQEVDALWWNEADSVVLYEVKFISPERMRQRVGLYQLERAARAAQTHPKINTVRTRLVYIGDAEERLLAAGGGIPAEQTDSDAGIVWITPEQVEWAARDLSLDLPADWRSRHIGRDAPCLPERRERAK